MMRGQAQARSRKTHTHSTNASFVVISERSIVGLELYIVRIAADLVS